MVQKGFTIIEVMVVVALIGILAAIAIPSFQETIERRRLIGAAENLFADLQYARSESIKRNEVIRFQATPGVGTDWCFGVDDDDGAACDCTTNACEIDNLPKNIEVSDYLNIQMSAGDVVEFDPRQGMTVDGAIHTYRFRIGAAGDSRTVCVNVIGRIRIQAGAAACI